MVGTRASSHKKRKKADYRTTITVLVGAGEETFSIHESIITNHSAFFRAACSGRFRESKERIVRLPEADPEIFDILLNWVYTKEIVTLDPDEISEAEAEASNFESLLLAKLYVLADQLDIRELRNAVTDKSIQLLHSLKRMPSPEAITIAYLHTPATSNLRKLIRDCYSRGVEAGWLSRVRERLPVDFIFDMALATEQDYEIPELPFKITRCRYHEHDEGEGWCD